MDTSPKQKTVEDVAIILLKEGISQGRHPEFQVVSNSMYPVLKIGDKISVKETPLNKLSCGDIVVYKLNQRLIAHRFLYLNDSDSFVTQGDNTSAIDQPIDKENLLGKITLIEKKDIQINLENKLWRYTNFLVGRAFMKKAQTLNKNTFIRLLTFFESRLLKIIARITNPVYGRISKKKRTNLL